MFPLPPADPYRLEGTTLATLLAASRNYKCPCWGAYSPTRRAGMRQKVRGL